MSSQYDATEFVDNDFQSNKTAYSPMAAGVATVRAPSREEVDTRVAEAHQKLAELKRAQEELERERAALEETRRRQAEFTTGRQEVLDHLTRGVGLLEEAEFTARRDADQLAKTLTDFREALAKVQAIQETTWRQDNFGVELTRALTTLENARMEWNSARLKFPVLSGGAQDNTPPGSPVAQAPVPSLFTSHSFGDLCRIGFAFTWPLTAIACLALGTLIVFLLRR
jgi:hypothetical protein